MAQSRILDYNFDIDHVIWWYEDHEIKEFVYVYNSILAFMKKLIRHIPDELSKWFAIVGVMQRRKKVTKMIEKMVSYKYSGLVKENMHIVNM